MTACSCGGDVDAWGQQAFVCKCASAGIPVSKELTSIYRDSVKWLDGVTIVPWLSGRTVAWDVTVATMLADSYLTASFVAAAAAAASRKGVKYPDLPASYSFQLIAVETVGPINESAVDFLRELGVGLLQASGTATDCLSISDVVSHCAAI